MLDCGFAECFYRGLSLSLKAQYLPQIDGGLCLAGCHVVAHRHNNNDNKFFQYYHFLQVLPIKITISR